MLIERRPYCHADHGYVTRCDCPRRRTDLDLTLREFAAFQSNREAWVGIGCESSLCASNEGWVAHQWLQPNAPRSRSKAPALSGGHSRTLEGGRLLENYQVAALSFTLFANSWRARNRFSLTRMRTKVESRTMQTDDIGVATNRGRKAWR